MTKVKLQVSRQQQNLKGVKKTNKTKAKPNVREKVLTKQLKDFGKVGGVIDKRIGVKDSSLSSSDAALRRHIIEKLRQMETLGTAPADEDDPIMRAAMNGLKKVKHASFDDELGGLSSDIVDTELFAGGVLTEVDPATRQQSKESRHDALLEKIAQTKEERLKRVEENEATRKKLKDADSEWTSKVRFMLDKLTQLKPKNNKAAEKMEKGRSEVLRMLKTLNSTKVVAPIGAKVETDASRNNRLLANLESIVSRRAGEEGTSATNSEEPKGEDIILRLLCRIGSYSPTMVAKIASELQGLSVALLSNAVRGLLLTQILIADVISPKVDGEFDEGEQKAKLGDRSRLNGIFVPEAVRFLTSLANSATHEGAALFISEDSSSVDDSSYASLDVRVALGQRALEEREVPLYRLGCLDRCLSLLTEYFDVYSTNFPAPVVWQMFSGLDLSALNTDRLPVGVEMKCSQLREKLAELKAQKRPKDITTADKVSLVLADRNATPQTLQKLGLVPQLEPAFDEKMDARRTKKTKPTNVELRQKLARERRGIVRELRKDAQFLANYDRSKIKASDELRKKKTKAIIASMRSID